jgi:hypothetical protein
MPNPVKVTRLLTRKSALAESRIDATERDLTPAPGEVILAPDLISLTTNNITYAAFGDSMNYWNFFPTGDAAYGHMPAWGFANVVASAVDGVKVGSRFYGYYPIASHVWMRPTVTARGFRDDAEHRINLVAPYNQYTATETDPYYRPEFENLQALLKPLFLTSAMLADFLIDNEFFGAKRVVFSSASSKTAYCTAFCLEGQPIECVALTSPSNQAFVEQLGCYGSAYRYQDLDSLPTDQPTLYVDFSSDLALRDRIHRHFGDQLKYSCVAGSAQNTDEAEYTAICGPKPEMYFAPVQMRKRNADWGPGGVASYVGDGMLAFYQRCQQRGDALLQVVENDGFEAAARIIADLVNGRVPANKGEVVHLS